MRTVALTARAHRFETVTLVALAVLALGSAALVIARLLAFGIPDGCFRGLSDASLCAGRGSDVQAYLELAGFWGALALGGTTLVATFPGLVFGIALVGKEIDRGTTAFAWSLAPSRRRWLVARVAPAAVAIVVVGLAAGLLADQLEALRNPGVDPGRTFGHLGLRGVTLPALGISIFGLALAAGSILGRILPALLVGAAVGLGAFVAVNVASDEQLRSETIVWVPRDDSQGLPGQVDWRVVDYRVMTPSGEIMTWNEAYNRYGDTIEVEGEGQVQDVTVRLRSVLYVNPGDLYPLVADRMAVLYAAIGLASIVLTFAVIDRRRP